MTYKKEGDVQIMYGRVTNYFPDKGYGFILGEDKRTYFIHCSNLGGERIEKGYCVHFKPFQNERSDYNAKSVIVFDDTLENSGRRKLSSNKKRKHKSHKSCNADRIVTDDKKFKQFVRTFLEEKEGREEAV